MPRDPGELKLEVMIRNIQIKEGPYSNHPSDSGGETAWGVTIAVARRFGYNGPMRDMPRDRATAITYKSYFMAPKFDQVSELSWPIALELFDSGFNCGVAKASAWLQVALNAFNHNQKDYKDVAVDGGLGPLTFDALKAFLLQRGKEGEMVMLRALNAQQAVYYMTIADRNRKLEDFTYGWIKNRVS